MLSAMKRQFSREEIMQAMPRRLAIALVLSFGLLAIASPLSEALWNWVLRTPWLR